tara:strand:+ start:273 stop:773 length:501 start_codon:yes stop_codon:yes gene_type:complete
MSPYYEDLLVAQYFEPELYNIIRNSNTEWVKYFNFTACLIDNNILTKDKFYKWLYERHPFKAGVLKMESKTMYNWHTDSSRGVCVNTLIPTPHTSFTFFRENEELNHSLIELRYSPGARFLFNNQKDHMVLNYGSPRFVLTTEFLEDKDNLTYPDLLEEIKKEYKE